jgi:hypothetical protein
MKYAACIAGHTRGFDAEMSLANSSLESLGVDFYISTWVNNGEQTMFWAGDRDKDHYNIKLDNLMTLYRPVVIDVEKRSDYDIFNHLDFILPSSYNVNTLNTLLMFKKMKKSIDYAVNSSKNYDLVFRSRFDINWLNLPDNLSCEKDTLYGRVTPSNNLFSDVFFYGDKDVMSRCVPDENFYTEELLSRVTNAEHIFWEYLYGQDIKVKYVDDLAFNIRGTDF